MAVLGDLCAGYRRCYRGGLVDVERWEVIHDPHKRQQLLLDKYGLRWSWMKDQYIEDHYEVRQGESIVAWVSHYPPTHEDVLDGNFEPGWHAFRIAENDSDGPYATWDEACRECERKTMSELLGGGK